MTVSQAFLASDPDLRLDVLARAEKLCPETCLVAQARIQPLVELDRMEEARAALLHLVRVRPTARTFFVLEEVFDHKHPKCISMYGEVLWDLLKQRIVQEVVVP